MNYKTLLLLLSITTVPSLTLADLNHDLVKAVQHNELERVDELLKQNVDPNCGWAGNYPLHEACSRGYKDIVKKLLAVDCNTDLVNRKGLTALFIACKKNNREIVKMLLRKGADQDTESTGDALRYPLIWAVKNNKENLVNILLNPKNVMIGCVNVEDATGKTPLDYAIENDNKSLIDKLWHMGAIAMKHPFGSIHDVLQSHSKIPTPAGWDSLTKEAFETKGVGLFSQLSMKDEESQPLETAELFDELSMEEAPYNYYNVPMIEEIE